MNPEDIAIRYLEHKKGVMGAFIFGSYARNPKQEHNDIDILVLTDRDFWRESEKLSGRNYEFFYGPEKFALTAIAREDDFNVARWFQDTKILFDSKNRVRNLIKEVRASTKTKLANFNKDWWAYELGDKLQDLHRERNLPQKIFLMNSLFRDVVQIFFLSKKIVPPKDNYAIKKLAHLDKKFYSYAEAYLIHSGLVFKEKNLNEMINYLEPVIGKPKTAWTTKKKEIQ